eukprot:1160294-Pelagomonas_calceolata.AAC.9
MALLASGEGVRPERPTPECAACPSMLPALSRPFGDQGEMGKAFASSVEHSAFLKSHRVKKG